MIPVASCFSQLLSLVDRGTFARAVRQHQAERGAKGFGCWDQFVAMLFCQMGGANSLREICGGLATATGKLVHLGLHQAPNSLHSSLCEYASALAALSDGVRGATEELPEFGSHKKATFPLQASPSKRGYFDH